MNALAEQLRTEIVLAKRIRRITTHVGLSRYLDTVVETGLTIPRLDIPSPYAFSNTHSVYLDPEHGLVFCVETAHKRYDVFRVPDTSPLSPAEVQ